MKFRNVDTDETIELDPVQRRDGTISMCPSDDPTSEDILDLENEDRVRTIEEAVELLDAQGWILEPESK